MSADPMLSDDARELDDAAAVIALVVVDEKRPAISYDRARSLLPAVERFAQRLADLRGWLTYVIEQDCAANARTELRIGERVFAFKGESVYAVESPADLHADLRLAVDRAEMTQDELDAAIAPVEVPARIEWKLHNGRLNDLAKRGGAVAETINRHRVATSTPPRLKAKGR